MKIGPFTVTCDLWDDEASDLEALRASQKELEQAWDSLNVSIPLRLECGRLLVRILKEIKSIKNADGMVEGRGRR